MNIKQAKEQIKNTVQAYLAVDELGSYIIPPQKQRPVFLMGPPGIGKTAIMEQIAAEMGIGLLSYSMTHHTRQSALGLPLIRQKEYQGKTYDISEYTMSEIIASVYDLMERTGVSNGILFLDEINCVSETLTPVMLQFLQYKVFGKFQVPPGWVVVTAGNPPEYNKSVRDFDIATWDRLKRIDIEPDFDAWKEYAAAMNIHGAVLTFLEIHKDFFYKIETRVEGKSFATARGWDDLSCMIRLCEIQGIKVDHLLISQYIQNREISREFAVYYDLYNKYKSDYQIDSILEGTYPDSIRQRAADAGFDERLALTGLLLDKISGEMRLVMEFTDVITEVHAQLSKMKKLAEKNGFNAADKLQETIAETNRLLDTGISSRSISGSRQRVMMRSVKVYEQLKNAAEKSGGGFDAVKGCFMETLKELDESSQNTVRRCSGIFRFCSDAFSDERQTAIIVAELTSDPVCARFLGRYKVEEYFQNHKSLMFTERRKELQQYIDALDLDSLHYEGQ